MRGGEADEACFFDEIAREELVVDEPSFFEGDQHGEVFFPGDFALDEEMMVSWRARRGKTQRHMKGERYEVPIANAMRARPSTSRAGAHVRVNEGVVQAPEGVRIEGVRFEFEEMVPASMPKTGWVLEVEYRGMKASSRQRSQALGFLSRGGVETHDPVEVAPEPLEATGIADEQAIVRSLNASLHACLL